MDTPNCRADVGRYWVRSGFHACERHSHEVAVRVSLRLGCCRDRSAFAASSLDSHGEPFSLHGYSLLASPILPGLLGVGLSKIPSGIWLWLARAVLVVTIIVGAILGGRNWYAGSVAARDMLNLVHGSREVEIAEFSIEYQQRKVICDDMAVCRHLAASLRKAKQGRGIDLTIGTPIHLRLSFCLAMSTAKHQHTSSTKVSAYQSPNPTRRPLSQDG